MYFADAFEYGFEGTSDFSGLANSEQGEELQFDGSLADATYSVLQREIVARGELLQRAPQIVSAITGTGHVTPRHLELNGEYNRAGREVGTGTVAASRSGDERCNEVTLDETVERGVGIFGPPGSPGGVPEKISFGDHSTEAPTEITGDNATGASDYFKESLETIEAKLREEMERKQRNMELLIEQNKANVERLNAANLALQQKLRDANKESQHSAEAYKEVEKENQSLRNNANKRNALPNGPAPRKKAKEGEKRDAKEMTCFHHYELLTRSYWFCRDQGRGTILNSGTETRRRR